MVINEPTIKLWNIMNFFFIFVINCFFLVGQPMCPILNKVETMFHTLFKIISKHPQTLNKKNVSFLPFVILMNTQPINTTQKLCKCIMSFYSWTPKTPIPNSLADALPSPKLAPSWANSFKLRNFWDSRHAPSFQHKKGGERGMMKAPG